MVKKVKLNPIVTCRWNHSKDPKLCENCSFFDKYEYDETGEISGVDCIVDEAPMLKGVHLTQFTMGGYKYSARYYDEGLDGKLSEEYEFCEKCCFNKQLSNGSYCCLLRSGAPEDADFSISPINMFICHEGEIWTKEKYDSDK